MIFVIKWQIILKWIRFQTFFCLLTCGRSDFRDILIDSEWAWAWEPRETCEFRQKTNCFFIRVIDVFCNPFHMHFSALTTSICYKREICSTLIVHFISDTFPGKCASRRSNFLTFCPRGPRSTSILNIQIEKLEWLVEESQSSREVGMSTAKISLICGCFVEILALFF